MKNMIIFLCVFLLVVIGLFLLTSNISIEIWIKLFFKVLSWIGVDRKSFCLDVLDILHSSNGYMIPQLVLVLSSVIHVFLSLYVSAILVEAFSRITANEDTRKFYQNEKSKNKDKGTRFTTIVDLFWGGVCVIICCVVLVVIPFYKIDSVGGSFLFIFGVIITTLIIQMIVYRIIREQIAELSRKIKNRKAWK